MREVSIIPNHKTMTPKEKADELIDKMYYIGRYDDKEDYNPAMAWERAKQCALIAVDEIINHHSQEQGLYRIDTYYWQQVKSELQSL
jgi:hypothetical protein